MTTDLSWSQSEFLEIGSRLKAVLPLNNVLCNSPYSKLNRPDSYGNIECSLLVNSSMKYSSRVFLLSGILFVSLMEVLISC